MLATSQIRVDDIEASFTGSLEPVRVTPLYRAAIAMVALCMLLLPLVYLGLVGCAAYGLYWHATQNVALFSTIRSGKAALFLYLAPLIVGGTLLLFMVKPLFAPKGHAPEPISLVRAEHPELFALIERLCRTINAPIPGRIDVNCEVNASAGFRRGFWSMWNNDLVLTIGLPLLASLNARQLTGVLAHEFGHFAQGSGMRVSFVIRSVNVWFARVVYGRDRWDQKLTEASQNSDIRLGILFYVARFFVWATRQVLKGLMHVGHLISCFLLRQMEFDADRYEARIAGSHVFGQTARRMPLISVAYSGAMADLAGSWHDKQLTDDFVAVVMHNLSRLPEKARASLESAMVDAKTSAFDTHPCDRERIASAEAERAEGIFQLELPASMLLRDFAAVSRRCSAALYADQIDEQVPSESLVPSEAYLRGQRERDAELDALSAFIDRPIPSDRNLKLGPEVLESTGDPQAESQRLMAARARIAELKESVVTRYAASDETHQRWVNGLQAEALLGAGVKVDADSFGLAHASADAARKLAQEAWYERRDGNGELTTFDAALSAYLHAGLRLALARGLPESGELESWWRVHRALHDQAETVQEIEREFFRQAGLLNNLEDNQGVQSLRDAVLERSTAQLVLLRKLKRSLQGVAYPFEHRERDVSLADALIVHVPTDNEDVGAVMSACASALQRVDRSRARVLARLLIIARAAEAA